MKDIASESLRLSTTRKPMLILTTVSLGVFAKIFTLLVFLVSIRTIAGLIEKDSETIAVSNIEEFAFPTILDSPQLVAVLIVLAYLLVGALDYWYLKYRSVFVVESLSVFKGALDSPDVEVTKQDSSRSVNAYRLLLESCIGVFVFSGVSILSLACLYYVNAYFGLVILLGSLLIFALSYTFLRGDSNGFEKRISNLYVSKLSNTIGSGRDDMVEMLGEKYSFLYVQQAVFLLSNLIIGIILAILIVFHAKGYLDNVGLFEVVVFIYTVRFLSNNGRNALLSYIRYHSYHSLISGYLENK